MKFPLVTRARYERALKKLRAERAKNDLLADEVQRLQAAAEQDVTENLLDYRGELTPAALRKLAGYSAAKKAGKAIH